MGFANDLFKSGPFFKNHLRIILRIIHFGALEGGGEILK